MLEVQFFRLDIRIGDSGVFIPDLTSIQVESADHVMQILRNQAYPNRSVSMTSMNDCSSRSHWYFVFLIVDI